MMKHVVLEPPSSRNHSCRTLTVAAPALIVFWIVGLLSAASAGEPAKEEVFWQIHGRWTFLQYLESLGCHACVEFAEGKLGPDFGGIASQIFGCADVDILLPSLHRIYANERRKRGGCPPGLLVDGGANVGRATARWMAALGDSTARLAKTHPVPKQHVRRCAGTDATVQGGNSSGTFQVPAVSVVAVEPSPSNFALLQRHAKENGWLNEGFLGLNAALGDKAGMSTLAFSDDYAIDEVATLLFDESDPRPRRHVDVLTFDDVVSKGHENIPGTGFMARLPQVFLLKLDIEGMEPAVLRSVVRSQVYVKYLTFEYSTAVWRENLEDVIADLHGGGFFCFLVTPERLVPISPPFWDDVYKMPVWSNAFCGRAEDPDLYALVQLHAGVFGFWPMVRRTYLEGYPAGHDERLPLDAAKTLCSEIGDRCAGITCDCSSESGDCGAESAPPPGPCTVRGGETGAKVSPFNEVSFMRDPEAAELFLLYLRDRLAQVKMTDKTERYDVSELLRRRLISRLDGIVE